MIKPGLDIMFRFFLVTVCLSPFLLRGQTRPCIKKAYAYYSITNKNQSPKAAGSEETIPFDTARKAVSAVTIIEKDTSLLVYIEARNQNTRWKTAQQGLHLFHITPILLQSPFQPGFTEGGGPIIITVSKGCSLFALQLNRKKQPANKDPWKPDAPLVLKGSCDGKSIVLKLTSIKKINLLPPALLLLVCLFPHSVYSTIYV